MGRLTTWLGRLALVPPVLFILSTLVYLALVAGHVDPVWHHEALNLSEAAALRDAGEVARLIDAGADPNATYEVRAGFLFTTARTLTPLEAARLAERPEIVGLLRADGAR
jgi:hypothetical protein